MVRSRVFRVGVTALILAACGGQTDGDRSVPAVGVGAVAVRGAHLQQWEADTSQRLDYSVLRDLHDESVGGDTASRGFSETRRQQLNARLKVEGKDLEEIAPDIVAMSAANGSPVAGDEQQLLSKDGRTLVYGPKVSLAASQDLAGVTETMLMQKLHYVATLINNDAQPYGILKIEARMRMCLYVGTANGAFKAFYVPLDPVKGCGIGPLTVQEAQGLGAIELATPVRVMASAIEAGLDPSHLPVAARWEWNGTENVAGVRCGDAWCRISARVAVAQENKDGVGGADADLKKLFAVWGWNDYQPLAVLASGKLKPNQASIRLVPAKDVEIRRLDNAPTGAFSIVGRIRAPAGTAIDPKYRRLGVVAGQENRVTFCRGSFAECFPTGGAAPPTCVGATETLWGQVGNGSPLRVCYLAGGPGHTAPYTARWRWTPSDEGLWVRCLNGCCQVDQF